MKYTIAIMSLLLLASCGQHKKKDEKQTKEAPALELTTVVKGSVPMSVKLPAQLAAWQEVNIYPKVNGYVKTVSVDIGSRVREGQLLMTLEAPEQIQNVLQEKEQYEKAQADYTLNKENYERLIDASKTAGAVSPLDISSAKARMDAGSALSNAAKANWQMQQTMLAYLRITAPFSGVITERNVHPGALVSTANKDKVLLELKQTDHLRLQIDVPENVAGQMKEKDTVAFIIPALANKKMKGLVSRKADNIDVKYRAERIEIDVANDGTLAPGMYADVVLTSRGNTDALIVPKSAVCTSTERKCVIVIRDGKTHKVDVITGNESADKIEINGDVQAGDSVVKNATDEIKESISIK